MNDSELLKKIADFIRNNSCDNTAFFLFTSFPGEKQRARYISNMNREDVLNCMQEFINKNKNPDLWGKHSR